MGNLLYIPLVGGAIRRENRDEIIPWLQDPGGAGCLAGREDDQQIFPFIPERSELSEPPLIARCIWTKAA